MTEQQLEDLAVEFIRQWEYYQKFHQVGENLPFEKWIWCREHRNFISDHTNPRQGEYAIQHKYTGVAFFTGSGELVFTEAGLSLAKKICDLYRKRGSLDMQIIKVEYATGEGDLTTV